MGSSFSIFTTFSSIPERRDEETFEIPLSVSSCGGTSVALGAILSCAAGCGGQPELHTDPPSAVTVKHISSANAQPCIYADFLLSTVVNLITLKTCFLGIGESVILVYFIIQSIRSQL